MILTEEYKQYIKKPKEGGATMVNLAVVGLGYWGPNLVRNFIEVGNCRVTMACDLDEEITKKQKKLEKKIIIYRMK